MKKFKLVVPSFIAIIFCMLLIAGSTFALFTSQASASIEVTSGKVRVDTQLLLTHTYSAEANEGGVILDENGAKYISKEQPLGEFSNGGSATIDANGKVVLTNITPGDRVLGTLKITNSSNVNIKYRVKLSVNESGYALAKGLLLTFGTDIVEKAAVANYTSEWKTLLAPTTPTEIVNYDFAFELPLTLDNEYQSKNALYSITVEAVQGNAKTTGETTINYIQSKAENLNISTSGTQVSKVEDQVSGNTTTVTNHGDVNVTVVTDSNDQVISTVTTLADQSGKILAAQMPETTLEENLNVTVTVPANTQLDNDVDSLLLVIAKSESLPNVTLQDGDGNVTSAYEINVAGVSEDNAELIKVELPILSGQAPTKIAHLKSDNTTAFITPGSTASEEHFTYDNGKVTFYVKSFSIFGIASVPAEASIGSSFYATLGEAINAAQDGQTVKLEMNVSLNERINIQKSIKIDGNNKTIETKNMNSNEYYAFYLVESGNSAINVEFKNLTINSTGYQVVFMLNTDYTSNVILNNVNVTSDGECIYSNGFGKITANGCALTHSGKYAQGKTSIYYAAVVVGYSGSVELNECSVSSTNTAIGTFPSGGTIVINDSTVTVDNVQTGDEAFAIHAWHDGNGYDNGSYPEYCTDAYIKVSNSTVKGKIMVEDKVHIANNVHVAKVELLSGLFTDVDYLFRYDNGLGKLAISGGSYDKDPSDYIEMPYYSTLSNDLYVVSMDSSKLLAVTINNEKTFYADLHEALNTALNTQGVTNAAVELYADMTFDQQAEWTPVVFNQAHTLTFEGNGHKITNLPGMLFDKQGSGGHHLRMSNFTFEAPKVLNSGAYSSVIMGYADSVNELYFENITINNAEITSGNYAGAFVGYAAGYNNQNDGPVFQEITFKKCAVTNSTIIANGSVGSFIGHATGNAWGIVTFDGCLAQKNTVSSTGSSTSKAGSLLGTVGAAGSESYGKTGGVYVNNTTALNNTVTSNNVTNTKIFGRVASDGGRIWRDGVPVAHYENGVDIIDKPELAN